MTEPLLFGTTFLAVALIAKWSATLSASGFRLPASGFRRSALPTRSRAAGWACVAAVLTRYEAWPIVAAAIGLAFVVLLRRGWTIGAALRAVRGLALWPLWALAAFLVNSKVSVGAWFVSGGFFVAENPALGHPWLAWTQIWEGLVQLAGPVLPWMAVVSAIAIVVAFVLPPKGGSYARRTAESDQCAASRTAVILPLASSRSRAPRRCRSTPTSRAIRCASATTCRWWRRRRR